jgi:hypothetical protein
MSAYRLGPARFGSLADIAARSRHVRFAPDSGHLSAQVGCPKSAISGYAGQASRYARARFFPKKILVRVHRRAPETCSA